METKEMKKIGIVCFIGGVIGTLTAFAVARVWWWLGMITGFAGGYLCYDLQEVWVKIPVAWRYAKKEILPPAKEFFIDTFDWLKEPKPFFMIWLLVFLPMFIPGIYSIYHQMKHDLFGYPFVFWIVFSLIGVLTALLFTVISLLFTVGAHWLSELGSQGRKLGKDCQWEDHSIFPYDGYTGGKGKNKIEATYGNIYGLMLRGVAICVCLAVSYIRKAIKYALIETGIKTGIVIFLCIKFLFVVFPWKIFKLIHSHKRLLCGTDGAIAVAISYSLLGVSAVTVTEKILVIICGGIIGAAIGIANYEIVLKRLLHLVPANKQALT